MAETWKSVPPPMSKPATRSGCSPGSRSIVSPVEPAFMGIPGMIAFIEDTPDRWFKQPMPGTTSVDVLEADPT